MNQLTLFDQPVEVIRPVREKPAEEPADDAPLSPFLGLDAETVVIHPGNLMMTAIFGAVTIDEVFDSEADARAAGYAYDGHLIGGDWPWTYWKVLARNSDFVHREYAAAKVKL